MQKPMGEDLAGGARASSTSAARAQLIAARQLSAALQPRTCWRSRQLVDERRARRDHRHRGSHRRSTSRGSSGRSSPARRASKCSTTRFTISTRSAGSRVSPHGVHCRARARIRRCRAFQRHAQLDHPRLRRSHPLLADAQPHASRRTRRHRASMLQGRRHRRRGAGDARREPRLPGRPAGRRSRSPSTAAHGSRCRCAARGSPRRSRDRCRTCSAFVAGEDRRAGLAGRRRDPDDGAGRGVLPVERGRRFDDRFRRSSVS